ncbi:hypothetical protein IL252_13125 [Halomicrobium sp. IBSBa]|nr:hypothetical protein [Halomicrobium sp. IBSBa]MBO4248759.1 hypothetical protein [Halomicrobium sp. IBSBa]
MFTATDGRPWVSRSLAWGVIGFELLVPLALVTPKALLLSILVDFTY